MFRLLTEFEDLKIHGRQRCDTAPRAGSLTQLYSTIDSSAIFISFIISICLLCYRPMGDTELLAKCMQKKIVDER